MLPQHTRLFPLSVTVLTSPLLLTIAHAQAAPSVQLLRTRDSSSSNPLDINLDPAPSPEDGPPLSVNALRDPAYLPAQIGGIVGAYAVSLVLVAITLLALSKRRREHIQIGNEEVDFDQVKGVLSPDFPPGALSIIVPEEPQTGVPNFSYPSPTKSEFQPGQYIYPSPLSSVVSIPGVNPRVDQRTVAADKVMAQDQLEEMYKYAFEHEEAKQKGLVLETPVMPAATHHSPASERSTSSVLSKKERTKPASLNLSAGREEKTQSRTSSLLSALRSPGRKKSAKAMNISSPIMTPQSGTFPRYDSQEIPLRQYAPQPPPPLPTGQVPLSPRTVRSNAPLTPDISPESVQSIDERIGAQLPQAGDSAGPYQHGPYQHGRTISEAPTEVDPESATSVHSQAPLVGLPSSPKPGATFQRPNAPSAVRTGGSLPLRAYEPAMTSPSAIAHTTKQTVFERKGPLSPTSGRTPMTAGAVPYSPYQPFTPVMPMTPSLVTKEDRKRMKKVVPKTPTLEMVRSSEDIW